MDPAEEGRDPSMVVVSLWNSAVSLWMKAMKTLPPHQCSHFERFVSTVDVSAVSVSVFGYYCIPCARSCYFQFTIPLPACTSLISLNKANMEGTNCFENLCLIILHQFACLSPHPAPVVGHYGMQK